MKLKKITVFSLLLTALCGCTTQPSNDTNNMLETKTYLYSYDYETEPNGELSTAYHEEKPSVDLNEPRDVVRATVNFKKNAVTYIKMNEKYSFGSCECAITQAYVTSDSNYFYTLVNENYHNILSDEISKQRDISKETGKPLVGAKIVVKNEAGKVIASWTSTNDYHVIEDLPNGKYTAQETEAPEGYILDTTPQEFTITDNNKNITLKLYDKAASKVVSIIKIDQDTKEIIAGAVLVIKDSTGKEIARFTTTNSAYTIENIANGTYTVEEVSAPEGYVLSDEKVTFTIDDKNRTAQILSLIHI